MCGGNCEWTELTRFFAALCFIALCIRWMDDVVDGHSDQPAEAGTYSLLAFAFAASLHPTAAVTFFFAAYAVGMLVDGTSRLPTGLVARHEAVVVWALGGLLAGWKALVAATLFLLAAQIADDLRDVEDDRQAGASNFAMQWGTVEASFVAVAALVGAAWLDPLLPVVATWAVVVTEPVAERLIATRRGAGEARW